MVKFEEAMNVLRALRTGFVKELKSHPIVCLLVCTILFLAFFVRVYRAGELMGFYFDQGRDALVIWKFLYEGKPFLIGPVTGLAGIFLGPLYYYLIAPFYFIGGGDPAYPAYFLAFLATCAITVIYFLGWKMVSRAAGLIAAILASFSYYLVLAGRWLSNPTSILLTSVLLLWAMWEITNEKSEIKSKAKLWMLIGFLIGVSLQLESASAIFYIPMICIFALWQRKNFPDKRTLFISSCLFLVTLMPQIIFNYRHENILFNNFKKIILEEKSFRANFWDVLDIRLKYFWDVFSSKIFHSPRSLNSLYGVLSMMAIIYSWQEMKKNTSLFLIFLGIPMLGYIFFQGNYGNIYDYYVTGYYLPMILLFSLGLGIIFRRPIGKIIVLIFLFLFLKQHVPLLRNYLVAGVDGPTHVSLGNQREAVNWVFDDAMSRGEFNVDVYVPPVIPHAYDYLFKWIGTRRCGSDLCGMISDRQIPLVYVFYEVDPPHPERLEAWLSRYERSTVIESQVNFGGIYVERRKRI